jgi:hypothetical protein
VTRYRYPLPRAYRRPRYPFRYRKSGSGSAPVVGIAVGAVLALGAGTGTAVTVTHHHHAAPARSVQAAPAHTAPAAVADGSETAFWRAMLADMGAPATQANLYSLDEWLPHEEPWPSLAAWNPLDSILPEPGSWDFNSFDGGLHVQSYPNAAEGAEADAATLANGNYPLIYAALRSGAGVCGTDFAAEFATWSGGGYYEVC